MMNYLFKKLEHFRNYINSKGTKYKLQPFIREEMIDFLKWNKPGLTDEEYSKLIDSYFEEKDFLWYGELRKIHGTNTRTSTFDGVLIVGVVFIGGILVIFLINFFL